MDPLALLCTLHADGPRTLRRLQREGFDSLDHLLETAPDSLVESLGWSESFAQRFLREGEILAKRVDGNFLEELVEAHESATREAPPSAAERGATRPESAQVERLLGTWRELDRTDPPSADATLIPRAPKPNVAPGPVGAVANLDALDPGLRRQLASIGIESADALLGTSTLELARRLGTGFTRASRLQFLVRRSEPTEPGATPGGTAGPFA